MESQQDIVDLIINDDDYCLFPTEPGEMVGSLLELDEMVGNKETAKQNDIKQEEDDTFGYLWVGRCEIPTDGEEEKEEEESKKIIFKRIWPNFRKKAKRDHIQICHI